MAPFHALLIILGLAVVVVSILRRYHLPPALGYILVGALVGPFGLRLLESKEEIHYIAEFGVVFMLFSIGLELSLPKLISQRRTIFGLGGMQVLLCTGIAAGIAHWAGLSWPAAIAVSGAFALSSTAVVTKQLMEQNEIHEPHGKLAFNVLLFQDLAAVPFLIIVPALALAPGEMSILGLLGSRLFIGLLVFFAMLIAGQWLLRPLFRYIAQARSSELFMLTTLLVALASAFLTEHFGLSAELGAFLAGVMLAETEYVHQIESDIQPFREILLGFFFLSIGLFLDPQVIVSDWKAIGILLLALFLFKTIIIALLTLTTAPANRALRTGIILAQGGEFGLFLLMIAQEKNLLGFHPYQILLTTIVLSMAISPLLIRHSKNIAQGILKWLRITPKEGRSFPLPENTSHYKDHVVICGYGRVGQTLARFLEYEGISFVGIDIDPVRLREAKAAQEPVFFGDPAHESTLQHANIAQARMLIIAFSHTKQTLAILRALRRLRTDLPVLVRTTDDSELEVLQAAGATEVIPDKLESSLMLASHMLLLLGYPPHKIQRQITDVKTNRYKFLRAFYQGENLGHLETTPAKKTLLHAVELPQGAFAVGKSLSQLAKETMLVPLASFSRKGFKCEQPDPDLVLEAGDILVLEGTTEIIYRAEEALLQG